MRINYNKALCIALAALFFTAQSSLSISWKQHYFRKLDGINYTRNCSLIDFAQKIRYYARILYYHTTYRKTTLEKIFARIERELKNTEKVLFDLEREKLEDIKNKYHIKDDIWQTCSSDIQKVKEQYKKSMLDEHLNVILDKNVPADILEILHALLKENDINAASISIVMANQKLANDKPGVLASTALNIQTYIDKNLIVDPEYTPATITIFPALIQESFEKKISICAHEIQHLVLQHSVPKLVLLKYLEHYHGMEEQTIRQSAEFQQLDQVNEAQAEIIAAIKNHYVSHCLTLFRKQNYYPKHLYEEHFYALSTIDMLWKAHGKLESLYFT